MTIDGRTSELDRILEELAEIDQQLREVGDDRRERRALARRRRMLLELAAELRGHVRPMNRGDLAL